MGQLSCLKPRVRLSRGPSLTLTSQGIQLPARGLPSSRAPGAREQKVHSTCCSLGRTTWTLPGRLQSLGISHSRAGGKEETRPKSQTAEGGQTQRRNRLNRRQEEEEGKKDRGEDTGGCQMGRERGGGGGKEERHKGTRTLPCPDAEEDGHGGGGGGGGRGSFFHRQGEAIKSHAGLREQEWGRKRDPCDPPTCQNCVPEEQCPCPQVPEEPDTGPKTGALKGPRTMCSGSLSVLTQRSLGPSAVSFQMSNSDLVIGSAKGRQGFVGT